MRERLPALVSILLLIVLVGGTWWAADYTQRAIEVDPARRATHEPDSWAQHFTLVRSNELGIAINRLEGDYMLHYPDDDSYEITVARAVGNRANSPITVATSDTAVMDQDGARITMQGNAHVHRLPDAERKALDVNSEILIVLPDEDVVYTDIPAVVVNGNSTMRGKGMRYDNNTRQLEVFSASDVKISGQDRQERRANSSNN
ncbi:LPS export ABC transporter periplasmic protein LptC [Paenalcaligenes niemegkensis]|uniref:LPS export ABC transporter periplasmic protein LptC n=1 Tax=Paenalcaligenes niemegkensis TaxID=2895469 RepID=UPI001EE83F5A|nr:LPS export ABC transporter periplasmic protein LptC [Paenalcaligenes niemegkensis]MCQ9615562.1 LPS export ABC transporter periplasmic protein LptC [Paenalcaligenes niemegkensis]